ncbi:hypothetical protein [Streptomyces purpureus]|uniref:Secreted protein n=1 Tax=Streptomyces purpureus TaxID=1951 RepID=A0A918H0V5_9ACTN|nr:hypothetical protein [Streptomyces purpureus]GGT27893.1 hypothetical protein GCM10014713_21710 [Streptomyces purpureus]
MRSRPIALRAAGAAVAVAALAPAAPSHAEGGVHVTVTPSTAAPGADVDIRVTGCKGTAGKARSKAFVADAELSRREGGTYPLFGDTTMKSDVSPGTYKVTVVCDGRDHPNAGSFEVGPKHRPTHEPEPSHHPTHRPTYEPTHQPHHSPVAPVRAGGGGAASMAAAPESADTTTVEEQGPGTRHTVIGLVLAAVAAVLVALRSVRRRRGADSH